MNKVITYFSVLAALLGCGVANAQSPTRLKMMADSLRREYRFAESIEKWQAAKSAVADSVEQEKIDAEMSLSQNGKSMMDFCSQPVVIAKQRFLLKDFFLYYPLEDKSWRKVPNQLDSLGGGEYARAMYIPADAPALYYSAADEDGIRNIYKTEHLDSAWSVPKLLNEQMTSSSDEIYPMLSPDGKNLYFASKGLYGMGGYDLYVSSWNEDTKEWDVPVNIGFPYSSPYDDLMFVNTADGRYSMFASNRECSKDSVYIYVLEYDSMPVRKAVIDETQLKTLSMLQPVNDLSKMDNSSAVSASADEGVDTRKYTDQMLAVRALRDSVYASGNAIDEARAALAKASDDQKQSIVADIQAKEAEQLRLQDRLSAETTKLQEIEMDFLMSGVVIDPEKVQQAADREVVGASTGYVFSRNSMGPDVHMNVLKPLPSFDYTFQVLPEGRFAENNTLPSGLVYQIQIFSGASKANVSKLNGLSPVFERMNSNGRYTYCAGLFRSYDDVLANLNKAKKAGFRDAIIVAFMDGKSVNVTKAKQMEKSVRQQFRIKVYPSDGKPFGETEISLIKSLTDAEISKTMENGALCYFLSMFDDREEADSIASLIKSSGISNVSVEQVSNEE